MLPVLQIGPLALQVPGLMYLLGIWLGLSLAEKLAAKRGFPVETLYNLVFTGLIAGLAGARLGYVLLYPQAFMAAPLSLFSLNPSLLDPWSGLAAGGLAGLIYGQKKGLKWWPTLDLLAALLAVFMVGVALAHVASGEAYGMETSLPWGIELWGAVRHPTQFYELAAAIAVLLALGKLQQAPTAPAGRLFLAFVALTAGARLFLEAFRGDSQLLANSLRAAQLWAWLALAGALWGLDRLKRSESGQNG